MTKDNEENEEKGFFQKIRLRRKTSSASDKKVWSPRKSKGSISSSSSSNSDDPVPNEEKESKFPKRRVIKATRPPSPTTEMGSIVSDQDSTEDNPSSTAGMRGDNKLPTIQNENLREKTEEWRQKRMDATAAIQKGNKEKGVKEHRLKSGKAADEVEGEGKESENENEKSDDTKIVDMEVSDIFKTRTFHPEHKRKAESHDVVEKKKKLDEVEKSEESNKQDEEEVKDVVEQSTNRSKLSDWLNVVVPAALVATCAVIIMKALRKR